MKHIAAILSLLLVFDAFLTPPAQAETGAPVVLELFTTQGCPSCPPMDEIVKGLAVEDSQLITLGCHVTYLDSEAWADTMGKEFCNSRHTGYFSSVPLGRIATPTLVVNGRYDVIGANEDLARSAIKMVRSLGGIGRLEIEKHEESLDVVLPDMPMEKEADVWLFGYTPKESVTIGGGANAKRSVEYINAVTHMVKLMEWNGRQQKISYPLENMQAEGYAIIVQEENAGPILAAGTL